MKSLNNFKEWLQKVNDKCQDPDLEYFLDIIEIYEKETH